MPSMTIERTSGHRALGIAAPRRRLLHPVHAAVLARRDEGGQPLGRQRDRIGRGDRDAIEAQPFRLAIDEVAQAFRAC